MLRSKFCSYGYGYESESKEILFLSEMQCHISGSELQSYSSMLLLPECQSVMAGTNGGRGKDVNEVMR